MSTVENILAAVDLEVSQYRAISEQLYAFRDARSQLTTSNARIDITLKATAIIPASLEVAGRHHYLPPEFIDYARMRVEARALDWLDELINTATTSRRASAARIRTLLNDWAKLDPVSGGTLPVTSPSA